MGCWEVQIVKLFGMSLELGFICDVLGFSFRIGLVERDCWGC